jgi:riboflavin kinase / FMN adenylyltransferase
LETFYEASPGLIARSAIALGFFDGVHPGHQAVISKAIEESKRLKAVATVVTFKDHPRTLTKGSSPLLLTVIDQRLELFEKLGIEATLVLSFTEELCRLSPEEYVRKILIGSTGAKSISVGYNHHFGKDREGDPLLLAEFGKSMDFKTEVSPCVYIDGLEVSSSRIRQSIISSQIELANKLLARPYSLYGTVAAGEARGSKIGFPTANLATEQFQILPARGVYAGIVKLQNQQEQSAVINVGYRPTFKTTTQDGLCVEAHILDFKDDIYGQKLEIFFHKFLREEKKFEHLDALTTQIKDDCQDTRKYFASAIAMANSQAKQRPQEEASNHAG